jgi:ribonuclease E
MDAHVEPHPDTAIEPNEATVEGEPASLDVTPQEALAAEPVEAAPAEAPKPTVLAEPFVAPKPEIDVEAIIAEDPNQIVAPPEKPKRGWWRR